jgi:hypothetical protein
MSKAKDEPVKQPTYRIPPDSPWANAWKLTAVIGVVGLATALFGMTTDPGRFAFSWLFAFMTFLAVGLGGLFFVLGQHLTGAGWGVTSRRTAEMMLSGLPVFAILFIPIALNLDHLYPWMHMEMHHEAAAEEHADRSALAFGGDARAQDVPRLHDMNPVEQAAFEHEEGHAAGHGGEHAHTPQHAEHEHIVSQKLGWFHLGGKAVFFLIRAAIYFIAWILLAYAFVGWSTRQDKEKGIALTKKAQKLAPAATFVFGFTLTFAAFDWMMSLEPSWYSTIFGVQYFAVSAVIGHVTVILVTLGIRRAGLIGEAVNVEHYHDLGKLLFGFVVFWAYISFSQFMLIWYAGIPEEATYYHLRWWGGGGFKTVSVLLILAGFGVPFFLLISRNTKRRLAILTFACIWLCVMHVVQVYWLIMPYAAQTGLTQTSMSVHWMDVAALLAVGGIYLSVVLWQMTRFPLVPMGDPRLARALKFENA